MKSIFYFGIITMTILFSGCGSTNFNYNELKKEFILTNNGKETILPNIILDKQVTDLTGVLNSAGNKKISRYKGIKSNCKYILITELLPLGQRRFYIFSVADDIETMHKIKPKKVDNIYILEKLDRVIIGFEQTINGMGADSKTIIEMSPECWSNKKDYETSNYLNNDTNSITNKSSDNIYFSGHFNYKGIQKECIKEGKINATLNNNKIFGNYFVDNKLIGDFNGIVNSDNVVNGTLGNGTFTGKLLNNSEVKGTYLYNSCYGNFHLKINSTN